MLPSQSQLAEQGTSAGLFSSDRVNELDEYARTHSEPADEHDVAKLMVKAGVVSAFQAQMLIKGKPGNLFAGPYKLIQPVGECPLCRFFEAEHRENGRKFYLCIQRPARNNASSTDVFRSAVENGTLDGMPDGKFERFIKVEHVLIAVLRGPETELATTELDKLSTVDGLPVVNAEKLDGASFDLELLDDPPDAGFCDGSEIVDEDDPVGGKAGKIIGQPAPISGQLVGSYHVESAPKSRRRRKNSWNTATMITAGVIGFVAFLVLIVMLRNAILSGG